MILSTINNIVCTETAGGGIGRRKWLKNFLWDSDNKHLKGYRYTYYCYTSVTHELPSLKSLCYTDTYNLFYYTITNIDKRILNIVSEDKLVQNNI